MATTVGGAIGSRNGRIGRIDVLSLLTLSVLLDVLFLLTLSVLHHGLRRIQIRSVQASKCPVLVFRLKQKDYLHVIIHFEIVQAIRYNKSFRLFCTDLLSDVHLSRGEAASSSKYSTQLMLPHYCLHPPRGKG